MLDAAALISTSWIVGSLPVASLAEPLRLQTHVLTALLAAVASFYGLCRAGAYSPPRLKLLAPQMQAVAGALLTGAATLLAALWLLHDAASLPSVVIDWAASCAVMLLGLRLTFHTVIRAWSDAGMLAQRIAIIGDAAVSARLLARLNDSDDYRILGLFNDQMGLPVNPLSPDSASDLMALSKQTPLDGIVIALRSPSSTASPASAPKSPGSSPTSMWFPTHCGCRNRRTPAAMIC
ncbi:MAG: hypothetical protein JOZ58_09340 [Acetobacteraceae bacterium]|nr:hypothetical protein [Acetobacteraceae bacterium]